MADSCHKAYFNISDRSFYKEGDAKQNKETQGRGLERSLRAGSTVHSDKDLETGQVTVWCASSWSLSSWSYVILVLHLKVSKSSRTGTTDSWSLYLLKLIPRILIQTCCLFTETMSKKMVGWVTIFHCYKNTKKNTTHK
uniref:Uncharacterized protein n=1 Tax=Myotis myotis TaxID=51298 RepID=A0A7J7VIC8_MYOMY|nr:hypothetical protein mMyoMyo1_008251 [Myotis myotis]